MSRTRTSERGFTLAGVIVLLTIISIVIAYTVPQQWSKVMARERDRQTIFAMKQYAQAIRAYQLKNNAVPTSLDQIKEARNPRMIRGGKDGLICPLTGKADWIVIPASAAQGATQQLPGQPPAPNPQFPRDGMGRIPTQLPAPGSPQPVQPQQPNQGQPGGFVGPIIGVRPNKTGPSFLTLNGATNYEQWSYTTIDLENEIQGRRAAWTMK